MRYIATIDQSTTGTKAMLFDEQAKPVCRNDLTHHQYYPQPGWVEQDAAEIFQQTCQVLARCLEQVDVRDVMALAITVQTGAFVVWDKTTGDPVYHIIGWQCSRGEEICSRMTEAQAAMVKEKSGTDPSGYLPAAKLQWMLENLPGLRERAEAGEVLFGTIETWLVWKLTGGKVHASDYCNASITQLFNVRELCWDEELLQLFHVPVCMLPELRNADADFGTVAVEGLPPLPITGIIGDSAAALFGQRRFSAGDVKVTYGTGSSILMNLGDNPIPPAPGTTTSITFWPEGGFGPMPRLPWAEKFIQTVLDISKELNYPLHEGYGWGGCDAASTVMNCPTIDGLAPVTFNCHNPNESLQLSSIVPRIALLIILMEQICSDDKYLRSEA